MGLRQIHIMKMKPKMFLLLKRPRFQWYTERGINFSANVVRTEEQTRNLVIAKYNQIKELIRATAKGTLVQNVEDLIERVITAGSSKQQNYFECNEISCTPHKIFAKSTRKLKI